MKICDRCKMPGLTWQQVDGRWRLYKGQTVHSCKAPKKKRVQHDKAEKWVSPPLDMPPPGSVGNWRHPWFAFVDGAVRTTKRMQKIAVQSTFEEMIP